MGGKPDVERAQGIIPAVVYGPEIEAMPIGIARREFEMLYKEAGESSLVDLSIAGGDSVSVLIQDVQYDPVKGDILHVDFRQVKMGEEMNATIELEFAGESEAVKTLGGTLIKSVDSIDVRCLPKNLVGSISVDLAVLKTFDDVITIGSLTIPSGMTVLSNPDTLVAKVTPPLTEAQLEAMEQSEVGSVDDVEVESEKAEDAEGSEEKKDTPEAPKEDAEAKKE